MISSIGSAQNKTEDIIADLNFVQHKELPAILQAQFGNFESKKIRIIKTETFPYSTIRIIQLSNGQDTPIRLFLKRITIPNKEASFIQQALGKETELLQCLNRKMEGETVEHVYTSLQHQTIVTRECAGIALESSINAYSFWWHNGRRSSALRHTLPALCGNWLKRYHETTLQKDKDLTPWYNYLSGEMIWRARQLKDLLSDHTSLLESLVENFTRDLKLLDQFGSISSYHGDFAPHNIFYKQQNICIIDFFGARTGHPIIDLINFIASIASRAESPLYPGTRIRTFCYQFMKSYGTTLESEQKLVSLLLQLQAVKRLLVLTNNRQSGLVEKIAAKRAIGWHLQYLKNSLTRKNVRGDRGPWPFLFLDTL
ncbi:MAG: phosphotransferase [Candidatus Reddybacter sp.]